MVGTAWFKAFPSDREFPAWCLIFRMYLSDGGWVKTSRKIQLLGQTGQCILPPALVQTAALLLLSALNQCL